MKFKIGDRVKIIHYYHEAGPEEVDDEWNKFIGKTGKIILAFSSSQFPYSVELDVVIPNGKIFSFRENELELYNPWKQDINTGEQLNAIRR